MKKMITLPSKTKYIRTAVVTLLDFLEKSAPVEEWNLELALSEALTNSIIHGNKRNPSKRVQAEAIISKEGVSLKVSDQGEGFDYRNLPDPTRPENFVKRNGRGLFLIHKLMDQVSFNRTGNQIVMTKFFDKPRHVSFEENPVIRPHIKKPGPSRARVSLAFSLHL